MEIRLLQNRRPVLCLKDYSIEQVILVYFGSAKKWRSLTPPADNKPHPLTVLHPLRILIGQTSITQFHPVLGVCHVSIFLSARRCSLVWPSVCWVSSFYNPKRN
uniref:Uncharacterized protein n=1 Tax=Pyxicephalus adspersus TaxID=30357 RepID=A0AAV3AAM4_PYXAD|nr:TPA: hypothetical protein GDO54_013108 [Pyxicephalus adspersus]